MDLSNDQQIYGVLVAAVTLLLVVYGIVLLLRLLRRGRPDFDIEYPIGVALVLRVGAAAGVSLTGIGSELRGGDEFTFLNASHEIAGTSFGSSDWPGALTGALHEFVLAAQIAVFNSPDFALRITEIGISVAGLVLLAAAVYELVGPRAAVIAAWLLALEPSGIFFASIIHKEPNMFLAEGLVAFGGARMWKRGDFTSLFIIVAGCLVAVATRPYAGWFLIATGAAVTLHAGLRTTRKGQVSALALIAVVVLFAAIAAPTVWEASSSQNLEENVQASQSANSEDTSANLSLEQVDFSNREAILTNVWVRAWDVMFRPYVWQLGSPSQRIGALGGLVTLIILAVLVPAMVRRRGEIFARAGPLVYLFFFLLIAYSLSTGNAGTGFRYRTHLLAIALCLIAALREWRTQPAAQPMAFAQREDALTGRRVPT